MKKLLLTTSLFIFCAFVGACQSNAKPTSTSGTNSGAVKSSPQSSSASPVSTGESIKKDTTNKPSNTTAIKHAEPNQAQIDSTKKAKTKKKNKKK